MRNTHPLAGQTVHLKEGIGHFVNAEASGAEFVVEDWAENVLGCSIWKANGNFAALEYALRTGTNGNNVPFDNNVVYGKVGVLGHFVHESEIVIA